MEDYYGGCGLGSRPCANCESEPTEHGGLFCSPECRAEYDGVDEMTREERRAYWFNEGRALGKDHAEAWEYALAMERRYA